MLLMESCALRKLKHFTDFHLLKRLAESLVLSRLDYGDSVYLPLPGYLLKRLQKIEFAATSFVYGRYVNDIGDILKLNWLPVEERRNFNLLKLTFKALHANQWPSYLNLQRVSICRSLRSSGSIRIQAPLEKEPSRTLRLPFLITFLIILKRSVTNFNPFSLCIS